MGYRIGLRSIPENFAGRLPWNRLKNRPFLRAAHGYALALEQARRHLEAAEVFEQILSLNPGDNQGIRYLLPSLYLDARAPQKARDSLERHGADGMNLYTRCLLEVQDGHLWEAMRWLCRGVSYNPHIPKLVLAEQKELPSHASRGVSMGSPHEAAEYLQQHNAWWRKESRDVLLRMMTATPFVGRLERAMELGLALDSRDLLPPGDERSARVDELMAIFGEDQIPKILEECRNVF